MCYIGPVFLCEKGVVMLKYNKRENRMTKHNQGIGVCDLGVFGVAHYNTLRLINRYQNKDAYPMWIKKKNVYVFPIRKYWSISLNLPGFPPLFPI